MPSVCFYFQVHQPMRIKKYRVFDVGRDHDYFNDNSDSSLNNKWILERVSRKSYLPTNAILLELLQKYPDFKISFSFSGVLLEQLERDFPAVLESFQALVRTGRADVLSETYHHSLSFLYSPKEFVRQVELHKKIIKRIFGVTPVIFRNTELIFSNEIAKTAEAMGYKGILAEGADHILEWRSPNFVYRPNGTSRIKLLTKNYRLSDDIAFRFSEKTWADHPLTAPKFAQWISAINGNGELVNLFMDYETFGEHQWENSGIFDFLRSLPEEILRNPDNNFVTPRMAVERYPARGTLNYPYFVSWADVERDLSAWRSNPLQHEALGKIYALEKSVLDSRDEGLIRDWRRLQTSDHFYYMCTKWFADGDVHKYFNPYETPYDAYIAYMNAVQDLKLRLKNVLSLAVRKVEVGPSWVPFKIW